VVAQSKDFNEFRQHLAVAAPTTAPAAANRQATGKVQALVEDKKAAAPTPDKLTLSKASAQSKAAEEKIAAERQAKDAAARAAELARNISELNKLKTSAASAPVAAASTATAAVAPAKPVASAAEVKPALAVVAPISASASAPAPASAPTVQAAASKPVAPKPVVKASAPAPEGSIVDDLLENPLYLGGGLGLVALLGGFAVYRSRRNKKSGLGESSFLDSHLQPDSFFGASGGEQVDTSNEGGATGGSSMIYSPSQLDASGEVDPVAEADVYLAYGRDQQAEDILKDALLTTPSRVAIHAKLADIYAKRADVAAFNANATSAHAVSQGLGAEWDHIRDLGRELDRDNALYQGAESASANTPEPVANQAVTDVKPVEPVDLDLDFDLDFDAKTPTPSTDDHPSVMATWHDSGMSSEPMALYDAPLDVQAAAPTSPVSAAAGAADILAPVMSQTVTDNGPVLETPNFSEPSAPPKIKSQVATSSVPQPSSEMLSFDLGALSLDLDPAAIQPAATPVEADTDSLDPLSTKLALAKEFQSIGDNDGAHALAEEVYTLATGQLRADAKRFLSELGFAQSGFSPSTL
jgi:pilus assembly protein FimV